MAIYIKSFTFHSIQVCFQFLTLFIYGISGLKVIVTK